MTLRRMIEKSEGLKGKRMEKILKVWTQYTIHRQMNASNLATTTPKEAVMKKNSHLCKN